jgi:hypothetical protein
MSFDELTEDSGRELWGLIAGSSRFIKLSGSTRYHSSMSPSSSATLMSVLGAVIRGDCMERLRKSVGLDLLNFLVCRFKIIIV